uniref:Condensation domain-containing protein n=1 Tax=Acrobeloides nanus TaxID=290746 RepID=A0A914EED4_9BILA
MSDLKKFEFDGLFVFENYETIQQRRQKSDPDNLLPFEIIGGKEKVDSPFCMVSSEGENNIKTSILYDAELFDERSLQRLMHSMKDMLTNIAKDVHVKFIDMEL